MKPFARNVSSCSARFTYLYQLSGHIILAVSLTAYIYVFKQDRIRTICHPTYIFVLPGPGLLDPFRWRYTYLQRKIARKRFCAAPEKLPSIQHISRILLEGGWLQTVSLASDLYRSKTRFASRLASRFQIALSLKKGSYLSHATAAPLHSLIEADASVTYVNKEQSQKNSTRNLSQSPATIFARL